jgi:hypothetical protein
VIYFFVSKMAGIRNQPIQAIIEEDEELDVVNSLG